jgi:hypothetical protein
MRMRTYLKKLSQDMCVGSITGGRARGAPAVGEFVLETVIHFTFLSIILTIKLYVLDICDPHCLSLVFTDPVCVEPGPMLSQIVAVYRVHSRVLLTLKKVLESFSIMYCS